MFLTSSHYYEEHSNVVRAKMREKEIKGWRRARKLKLILANNATGLT